MTSPGGPFTLHGPLGGLETPVLVVQMSGWIDASAAANAAAEHIARSIDAKELVTFDDDTFIDYRARRPVMELRDGVNTRIVWSAPTVRAGRDSKGSDIILLTGPEPDSAWRYFARTVGDLAAEMGVSKMIALGAYPYGAPHTRPVGLSSTTPDEEISRRLPHTRNSLDAPAGVAAVLEHEFHSRGIAAMGFWAQIPHYVSAMPYPAGSAALVDAVCREASIEVPTISLMKEAVTQRERLDELVAANPEHVEMLARLEEAYDALRSPAGIDLVSNMPNADQLAAEVEQFLREQDKGGKQ